MTVVKPNLGPHAGVARNRLTFGEAYVHAQANPTLEYCTVGAKTFAVTATRGQKGRHKDERVLLFKSRGKERARAYDCCWGHRTNCNSTHIDIYTEALP